MNKIRNILNDIKWQKKYDLSKVKLWFIHRGAPNDIKIISGDSILSIEKTFLETNDAMIPHHRIFKITYEYEIIFKRRESK